MNNNSLASIATVAVDTAYNGWSNRETWLVSLWLNNDESLYSQLLAAIELQEPASIRAEWLAERVQEQLDWHLEDQDASLWVDMLRGSFYQVDAVRQVVTVLTHYRCDKAMVITNSSYTPIAEKMARSNKCVLVDGRSLKKLERKNVRRGHFRCFSKPLLNFD